MKTKIPFHMKAINFLMPTFFKDKFALKMKKIALLSFLFLCCNNIVIAQTSRVPWLEGSWGVRLIMQAGSLLDNAIDNSNYNYVEYAKQINQNYPTAGHVITNFNGNANGTIFTLRQNDNVDIAAIDPTMVPSLANEQAIFDVINELKTGGKRVLLYINFTPNMGKANDTQRANWDTYVNANFSGNYMDAYNNLMEGFIKRFAGLIDGYWIDSFSYGTNADKDSFIQMLRTTDPNAILSVNFSKSYFSGIQVDSDGVDDVNTTDYNVIKFQANDIWSDYTGGHVTPIGQGAPPNSWAYEEFTVPDIEDDNLSTVTRTGVTNSDVLKHMFTPIRERWTSSALPLIYSKEQAYRMIKRITDAGGGFTFSTTTSSTGLPMPDELEILTHVNDQLEIDASYVPYTRPLCAYLVGEDPPADISVCTTDTGNSSNIALTGTATQSETLNSADASRAIDGVTDGVFARGSVIAAAGPDAWWQVELDNTYNINEINVFNRTACCEERLADFTVFVLNGTNVTYEERITEIPDPSVTLNAAGAVGNIVRIESNITSTLNIAEVEVYGEVATLSVDTIDGGNDKFLVHPNPVSNIITIDFKGATAANVSIFDYSGKTIRSGVVENGSNSIDLSDLASGLYIVKVFNEEKTYIRKLIKK